MSKTLVYLMRAFSLAALLGTKIPMYLADNKVTVDELVDLAKSVLEIGGWKAEIEIPTKLQSASLPFKLVE